MKSEGGKKLLDCSDVVCRKVPREESNSEEKIAVALKVMPI